MLSAQSLDPITQQSPVENSLRGSAPDTAISDLESRADSITSDIQPSTQQQNAPNFNQGNSLDTGAARAPFPAQGASEQNLFNDNLSSANPNRINGQRPEILRSDESYDLGRDPTDQDVALQPELRDSDLDVEQDLPSIAPERNRFGSSLDALGRPINIPLQNGTVTRQRITGRTEGPRTANSREQATPYQALGIPLGSFFLFPSLIVRESYTDNVFISATSKQSDGATVIAPGFLLESNWDNHALELNLNGVATYFYKFKTQNTKNLNATLRARVDVTSRTDVRFGTGYQINQETGSSPDFPTNAVGPSDVKTKSYFAELNHRFNRLSVQLRGVHDQLEYENATSVNGQPIDNSSRDRKENAAITRLTYEFSPRLTVFLDNNFRWIDYKNSGSNTTLNRDNFQMLNAAGFRAEFTPVINGELRVGNVLIDPKDPGLSKANAFIVDASLAWTPTELTTVRGGLVTTISETTEVGGSALKETLYSLGLEHRPLENLTLNAGLSLNLQETLGTDREITTYLTTFGTEYRMNRNIYLTSLLSYTDYNSSITDSDYTIKSATIGIRLQH